jgi:5-methylcytosine-specific restriction endonuclease McrA
MLPLNDTFCMERYRDDMRLYLFHRRARKNSINGNAKEYARTLRKDPCVYCANVASGTVDHIDQHAQQGFGSWQNLAGACPTCNQEKADTPLLLFMAMRNSEPLSARSVA